MGGIKLRMKRKVVMTSQDCSKTYANTAFNAVYLPAVVFI